MERAEESLKGLWRTARTLWIKYCGISDEYKMLRDRWLYLHGENKLTVLPYLKRKNENEEKKTFDFLDEHTKELEERFGEIGFKRVEMESFDAFKREVIKMDITDLISEIKLIEDYFFDLANFVGLLKSAFFQRTVSAEIQHVVSGLPHSPERTIGNELFYLAADNVARRYYECLNIPYGKWDEFITFTPPITEEYFYGAFYNPSPYLKLFHVSMSEEAKYFVGSYLALAHEFGHGAISIRYKIGSKSKISRPGWFKLLTTLIWANTTEYLKGKEKECADCPLYQNFLIPDPEEAKDIYGHLCEELLVDIIACSIAGNNYEHELLDSIAGPAPYGIMLRMVPTITYLRLNNAKVDDLMYRAGKIAEAREKNERITCPTGYCFSDCIFQLGIRWAKLIDDFDKNMPRYILINLETLFENLTENLNEYRIWTEELKSQGTINVLDEQFMGILRDIKKSSKNLITSNWKQLFPAIIKEKFSITQKEKEEISYALRNGIPIPEKDPRHILHCYYEAYKQSDGEKRPHYAATIYSLAFNTYSKNRRQRE